MAEVKRSLIKGSAKGVAPKAAPAPGLSLTLPTTKSEVSHDPADYSFLIHGTKKIGKTTLTTVEGDVFLLTFDPIQKSQELFQRHCPDWKHFEGYLKMLEAAAATGKFPYRRVVVDGVDIMYTKCQKWVEKKELVDHISEIGWARGWDTLKFTFAESIRRLLALPGGCWFISHSDWREVDTRRGIKVTKLVPLMKGGAEELLIGPVDGWFAYDYVGKERVLIVTGDERTGAGHRVKGHFQTPNGRPIYEIPMGDSEEEGWANFLEAFHNRQKFVDLEERDGGKDPEKGGAAPAAGPKKSLLKR